MGVSLYIMAGALITTGNYAWKAHNALNEYLITKPEVVAMISAERTERAALLQSEKEERAKIDHMHDEEILVAGSKADYLLDARIAQLNRLIGELEHKARQGKATPFDLQNLRDLKAEVNALQQQKRRQ